MIFGPGIQDGIELGLAFKFPPMYTILPCLLRLVRRVVRQHTGVQLVVGNLGCTGNNHGDGSLG